jgi:hypothetical protein
MRLCFGDNPFPLLVTVIAPLFFLLSNGEAVGLVAAGEKEEAADCFFFHKKY